jgi:spore maturation protein CgeB
MRVLVIDSDYLQFLARLYRENDGLERRPYEEQLSARRLSLFGTASSYAAAFRELGHDALELFTNNGPLLAAWAREHAHGGLPERRSSWVRPRDLARRGAGTWRGLPGCLISGLADPEGRLRLLIAQIEAFQPDVVLNQDLGALGAVALGEIRARTRILVGQHAATPLPSYDYAPYDLIVSSFPPTVDELRGQGVPARLSRLGFDPAVLDQVTPLPQRWGLTFVGSLAPIHSSRREFLESIARLVPDFRVWSPERPPRGSLLRRRHMGTAWGRSMFEILRSSRATLNHHGDIAPYANNMRLFEATGVGTLLLTDSKPNLEEMFAPGQEVIEWSTPEECADLYSTLDDETRNRVAAAGQRRTLRDHTYVNRVRELLQALEANGVQETA